MTTPATNSVGFGRTSLRGTWKTELSFADDIEVNAIVLRPERGNPVAIVVGDLVGCEEPADSRVASPSAGQVVRERLGRLPIPVALGARIGHGERNLALPYGVRAELDTQAGTLTALAGAVA